MDWQKRVIYYGYNVKKFWYYHKKWKRKRFFSKINSNQPTKEFWNDCRNIRKNINENSMVELNALMDKKDNQLKLEYVKLNNSNESEKVL